jgi:sterol 3beta-glucosyltransferase
MPPTVTLLTSGTLGDVRPFVALGLGLVRAGLSARVVTHQAFEGLVRGHGLDYGLLEGDQTELLHADPSALTLEAGPLRGALATARFVRRARPLYERMLASAYRACRPSDALVAALPTWWGADLAAALGIPCVFAPLQPITPTRQWPSALLPLAGSLGSRLNLLSHRLVDQALRLPWRDSLARWRRDLLRLEDGRRARDAPHIYGFSPWLVPPPPDWPPHHRAVGFWPLEERSPDPPAHLAAFLARGEPPVYLGFGSMGARAPLEDARLAIEATRRAGARAVLLGGSEAAGLAQDRPDVCVVAAMSHAWLLPQVAAAIHHGGAGTTGACLRAGVASVVAPSAADQFFWGGRIARVGAGPPPVPRRSLTAARLAELIREVLGDSSYRTRAGALGALVAQERGVERAVELIARQLSANGGSTPAPG